MNLSLTGAFPGLNKASYKTFSKVPAIGEITEKVHCPICYSGAVKPHWDCGNFVFSRCVSCGHLYQNPRPVSQDLIQRYDEEYSDYEVENSQNFFTLMRYGLRDAGVFSMTNQSVQSTTPESQSVGQMGLNGDGSSKLRALDIGCATGVLVRYLNDIGWDAEGLEVCAPAARIGIEERNVKIHLGTLDVAALPEASFDLIHFSHVIEHLSDVNSFMAEVSRICRPGGTVVITTPNRKSLQAGIMGRRWRSAIADHTHLFSPRELGIILKRHGFVPEKKKTWGGIPVGMAPAAVKRIGDRLARILGIGDVVMIRARRQS